MTPRASPSTVDTLGDPRAIHRINMSWLLRLHWAAIFGQALVVAVVQGMLHVALPLGPLVAILVVEATVNAVGELWVRSDRLVSERMVAGTMAVHVTCFTGLLYFTGGPMNPFSFLYLVHIALATLILRPRWTWTLVFFSLASSAALFIRHVPLPMDHGMHAHHRMSHGSEPFDMHLRGMWVAFAIAAAFIVYFLYRVTRDLAEREADLATMRDRASRNERLASMATLAAGAAHELATPLATIAVIAKELERQIGSGSMANDARSIRESVERCREIIAQLSADAGQSPGEASTSVAVEEIVDVAVRGLSDPERVRVHAEAGAQGRKIEVPLRATAQALRNVLKNAIEASPNDAKVIVRLRSEPEALRLQVEDTGAGMPAHVAARCMEPFFTTKEPGSGMGLGLFLTRSVVDQLGGTLTVESGEGIGTTVALIFPDRGAANGRVADARTS